MSALNSRGAIDPRWARWGLRTLSAFETTIIAIYQPNSATSGNDFDPYASPRANNETSTPTLLWTGKGQMQVFRNTLTMDDVAGSVTQVRSVRFTVDLNETDMPIRKGLIVRVLSCPHDPAIEEYEFVVMAAIGSGLAWKRTLEAESDMAVVAPPITQVTP